jgi:hypothetical protein
MKRAFVWILVAVLAGCSTLRPVEGGSDPAVVQSKVHVGDRVQVTTRDGQSSNFLVTALGPDTIAGNARRGRHVELPYQQIDSIEVRRFSTARTVSLVVGVVLVTGAIFAVAVAHDFADLLSVQ